MSRLLAIVPHVSRRIPSITSCIANALPRQSRILVAVSGGWDSNVLLHALSSLVAQCQYHIIVGHVDHGLRDSSAGDACFVSEYANSLGIKCLQVKLDRRPDGENIEAWAREHRYKALQTLKIEQKLDWIVTAHHADDVAETLLMRLLANKELSTITSEDARRNLIRPLLSITRNQIELYAEANNVPFRHDESNDNVAFTRNRIRHHLTPFLISEFGEHIPRSLAERADAVASDEETLRRLAERVGASVGLLRTSDLEWFESAKKALLEADQGLRWRLVELFLSGLVGYSLGRRRAKALLDFFLGNAEVADLGSGCRIILTKSGVIIEKTAP